VSGVVDNMLHGFAVALSLSNLGYCFLGVFLGTFVGALPGIGALATVSILLPVTFYLDPTTAIVFLAGVYYGSEYGGSIASILLNVPGSAASAVTCLDGYQMARQGRAGAALLMTTLSSFVGGTIGVLIMMFASPAVVALALAFGPAEYFAVMVFALFTSAAVTQGSPLRGLLMVLLGLMLGCVGADMTTGTARYDLGFIELFSGIGIVPLAMGLFGVSEVIASIRTTQQGISGTVRLRDMRATREDFRRSILPTLRGTAVGSLFGPLPGTGPTIAAFVSYAFEKRVAREPQRFGRGAIEGVASPEAANNAAAQTAFIPTMAMGIPGTPTMAIILGALMIHGIAPGPRLVTQHAEVFWGLIASFWNGKVMLLILNIPMIGIWVRILTIPYRLLYPSIICIICIGAYSVDTSVFDVALVLVFGVVGYAMRLLRYEPAPLLIGFILGPLIEQNFRRAMLLAHGDPLTFLESPIAAAALALTAALVLWWGWTFLRGLRAGSA